VGVDQGKNVELGMIGLGTMGGNMRERLRRAGHTVVGYDRSPTSATATALEALVAALPSPKVVWVMVPHSARTPPLDRHPVQIRRHDQHAFLGEADRCRAADVAQLRTGYDGNLCR
jgi:prephenate dehydrogenase